MIDKEFQKIKEHIDHTFSNVVLLEVKDHVVFHNSLDNVIREIFRYAKKNGFSIDNEELMNKLGYQGNEHAHDKKQKYIDKGIDTLEGIFSMFGMGAKILGWLAKQMFSKSDRKSVELNLYKNNTIQNQKYFIEIINRGYRFELKLEIR